MTKEAHHRMCNFTEITIVRFDLHTCYLFTFSLSPIGPLRSFANCHAFCTGRALSRAVE